MSKSKPTVPSHSKLHIWNFYCQTCRGKKWVAFKSFSTVQFSRSVMPYSLWPHGLQQARVPCPSPTTRASSNSCPSSRWGHPTISSSVISFSSCLQSFPASGSFQMSQFFTPGSQSTGASASATVLPMNIQDWFPFGWIGWISLQSKGLSRLFFWKVTSCRLWCSDFGAPWNKGCQIYLPRSYGTRCHDLSFLNVEL